MAPLGEGRGVQNREFKKGKFGSHSGWPTESVVHKIIKTVKKLLEKERRITYRQIDESLCIPAPAIRKILHKHLHIKKICSWSGSVEIGVTSCDPESLELPSSATDLRDGSWIMSGISILKDGRSVVEVYGVDLDKLKEGDRVGVMRTSEGELVFYVNGVSQGVAADDLPSRVYAVVDLYGKCAQVTITDSELSAPDSERSESEVEINNDHSMMTSTTNLVTNLNVNMYVNNTNTAIVPQNTNVTVSGADRLQFYERCGTLVKLSCNNRTAERRRPLDEFNNGVVMTHRPLRDNELFE
ncbi:hypothetical protein L9F63_008658, partial [Diploptera punctata]